jgi:hypothetical protein
MSSLFGLRRPHFLRPFELTLSGDQVLAHCCVRGLFQAERYLRDLCTLGNRKSFQFPNTPREARVEDQGSDLRIAGWLRSGGRRRCAGLPVFCGRFRDARALLRSALLQVVDSASCLKVWG